MEIRLDNEDRTFHPDDMVSGVVVIDAGSSGESHQGITLFVLGCVKLQLSAKSIGIFEAFYSTLKPLKIIENQIQLVKPGRLRPGRHEFPFQFKLKSLEGMELFDTYHGVYINVNYGLYAKMNRGMLKKEYNKEMEFFVETVSALEESKQSNRHDFKISPEQLRNISRGLKSRIPEFLFEGYLENVFCDVTQPFCGELLIRKSSMAIKSIELQLVRVERCPYMEGEAREATEVQNIQIADGDVVPNLPIPIHMIFPRLFTCTSIGNANFKLNFEINLHVVFEDNHMVTENFPLKLYRSAKEKTIGIMSGMW